MKRSITIRVFDLFVISLWVSSFGFGLFGGYSLMAYAAGNLHISGKLPIAASNVDQAGGKEIANSDESVKFVFKDKPLTLYSKPDTGSDKKAELKEDSEMKVIDRSAGWYRITLDNGSNGWVQIKDLQN